MESRLGDLFFIMINIDQIKQIKTAFFNSHTTSSDNVIKKLKYDSIGNPQVDLSPLIPYKDFYYEANNGYSFHKIEKAWKRTENISTICDAIIKGKIYTFVKYKNSDKIRELICSLDKETIALGKTYLKKNMYFKVLGSFLTNLCLNDTVQWNIEGIYFKEKINILKLFQ